MMLTSLDSSHNLISLFHFH